MQTITIEGIDEKLHQLSAEKLKAVYYFVSYLAENKLDMSDIGSLELMIASNDLITKEWNTAEEDKAWANL